MQQEQPIDVGSICFICGTETENVYPIREWIESEREANHAHFTEDEYNTLVKYGPAFNLCKDCWIRTRKKMINR